MAITDLSRRVITRYEAITTEHEKALEKLKGKTEESRKGFADWAKGVNESLNKGVDGLGKLNQAFEGASKIIGFGRDAIRAYGQDLRLEAAAGSANVEKLSAAFDGLFTKHQVLTFAAQTQRGVMKLNQDQMETLAKATVSLTRAGFDQEEVFNKLKDAAIGLKVNGLDDLGIAVEKGATNAETLSNMMKALGKVIQDNKGLTSSEADDVERLGIAWDNAKDGLMAYAGATLSLSAAKEGRGLLFDATNVLTLGEAGRSLENRKVREANASQAALGFLNVQSGFNEFGEENKPFNITEALGVDTTEKKYESFTKSIGQDFKMLGEIGGQTSGKLTGILETILAAQAKAQKSAKEFASIGDKLLGPSWSAKSGLSAEEIMGMSESPADRAIRQGAAERAALKAADDAAVDQMYRDEADSRRRTVDFGDASSRISGAAAGVQDLQNALADLQKGKQKSFLESTFGAVDEWDTYQSLFQGLQGAIGGTYEAIIKGSEPAGAALRKGIAAGVMATGKGELVQAIKEEAWAIGSFAYGNIAEGTAHQLSALKHGAAAALAGVVAKELGAGGGGGSSGGGSGGSGSSSGGSSSSSPSFGNGQSQAPGERIIVLMGDSQGNNSPRMEYLNAQRVVDLAFGGNGVTNR